MIFNNGIEITNLRNVQRFPDGAFMLLVDLKTPTDPLESVEYVARDGDVAVTGQWIYQQIIEGNFEGEITEWVPPPPPTVDEIAAQLRQIRDRRLQVEVDPIVSNPLRWNDMSEGQQQVLANYRRDLLDLPNNELFPWYNAIVTTDPKLGSSVDFSKVPWPTPPV